MKPLTTLATLAALCGGALLLVAATQPLDLTAVQRMPEYAMARATADSVMSGTRALLMREIAAQGTARALSACGAMALQEATRHQQEGWRVRRVSRDWRNPADAPDRYETQALSRFEGLRRRGALTPQTESAEVVTLDGRPMLRYLRPVVIPNAFCLQCHGAPADLASDVKVALRVAYPKDRAIGHRVGDLRGAISIAIPVEGPQP
jgi:hypothetical protein